MWPIPCMVSAHVSTRLNFFSDMKIHTIHVDYTVYGSSTCVQVLNHKATHHTCSTRFWGGAGETPLSRGLPALRMTPWASTCSPSPDTRVTSANSLVLPRFLTTHKTVSIPFMVPGHVTHQATLKLEHIASKRTCDPYPAWFQAM